MTTPTYADWRALVETELAGASFDRLVQRTPEGLALEPLYHAAPARAARPAVSAAGWRVCMRASGAAEVRAHLAGGADGVWLEPGDHAGIAAAGGAAAIVDARLGERAARVSLLATHGAGADAADELAIALADAADHLRAGRAAGELWYQVAVGRDTFGELCKVRALRLVADKLVAACGADAATVIHAVSSPRTTTVRDPWVNMLRVTTQVFAAAIAGADWITPLPFDQDFHDASALGARTARNTALVLRDESHLGRVLDAGGGSYYLEARTDALARLAWERFREIERVGRGPVAARVTATAAARAAAIAKRTEPILGVSEFANLAEALPGKARNPEFRDAYAFEALRERLEGRGLTVHLVPVGAPAAARGRVAFATQLFAAVGIAATEVTLAEAIAAAPALACLCGSDEQYATDAARVAAELRAAGVQRLALAGKPRDIAGCTYLYLGCDVLAAIEEMIS